MKQKGQTRAGLGAASMVLILLVLCLALLGVLSLVTARADLHMSRRDHVLAQQYAQAAAAVQQSLADLDAQMAAAWQQSENDQQYAEACMGITQAGDVQVCWLDEQTAEFSVDAGAQRELVVQIKRELAENAGNKRYYIEKHALRDMADWEQTESLVLMGI